MSTSTRHIGLALGLLLCAQPVSAQVAYDNALITTVASSASPTMSFAASGTNLAMVLGFVDRIGETATAGSFNGQAATFKCRATSSTELLELWTLTAPAATTANVAFTLTGAATTQVFAMSFSGVDQTTAFSGEVCDAYATNGITHAHNTSSVTNGMVADAFSMDDGGGTVVQSQTNRYGVTNGDSENTVLTTKAGGATVSTGYSWDNDFWRWVHATISVNPVAASSGPCPMTLLGVGRC